jgi:predicted transcriptional regulator of viral defense system
MLQNESTINMQSTENKIIIKIKNSKRGKIFFHDDFATFGTPGAIRLALSRIEKKGLLVRVAHGIYSYPRINKIEWIDEKYILPTTDEIAHAIAKRDKIRIVPTTSHALNVLGLSTQIPANAVYITDGTSRRIKTGKGRGILFKNTSNIKNLVYKSELLMLIVLALREIGESKVTDEQLSIIKEHFLHITKKEFETDIKLIPLGIRQLLLSL